MKNYDVRIQTTKKQLTFVVHIYYVIVIVVIYVAL